MFELSAEKIRSLDRTWPSSGAPVFTVDGRYTARGWTEWTEGFVYGAALLQFDATGERAFLDLGQERTLSRMSPHLTHVGVHDHGFNNVSTYGNLWRLAREQRIDADAVADPFLRAGAESQRRRAGPPLDAPARRRLHPFLQRRAFAVRRHHSFVARAGLVASARPPLERRTGRPGRSARAPACSTRARPRSTASISATGRDTYDVRGRVAHESLFNAANGTYRGPNSQQGYSPFSTWTRGLAWAMLGFAEQIEFIETLDDAPIAGESRDAVDAWMLDAARATCDFYIDHAACADGIPYWDTGAPGLSAMPGWGERDADPFNDHEPVESSAAAIAAQGLLRLGHVLDRRKHERRALHAGGAARARHAARSRVARISVSHPITRD